MLFSQKIAKKSYFEPKKIMIGFIFFHKTIDKYFRYEYNKFTAKQCGNKEDSFMFKGLEKVFDIIGEILAVVMVVVFALLIINANFNFLPAAVLNVFEIIRTYGSLVLIAVVGLEAMAKRNFVFQLIFIALLALIVIFMFFPGTYENLIGLVK